MSLSKKNPEISVITPVYNTEKYLKECLDSVISQTFKNIEIICIDDGSTDNSLNILKEYAKKDSRIKIIQQKNLGVVLARNNAINKAKGKYIYLLDSDDIISPVCLEMLYDAIIHNKGDVITSKMKLFGEKNGIVYLPKITKLNMSRENCIPVSSLFKKSDFIEAGGFDNVLFKDGWEDYDLWLNLMFRLNKKFYRVEKVLFFYRIKEKQESRNAMCSHKKLLNNLKNKYPQFRILRFIKNVMEELFFKRRDNYIKILFIKIPYKYK